MVLRRDAAGVLAVGQPAHAVLCGQFARAWGNRRFATPEPLPEVARGAEQHDVGWARWDLTPELNPETGLPLGFTETPLRTSAALWRTGPPQLESQSRWAALLATIHGRRLYERIDLATRTTEEAEAVRLLLEEAHAREARLVQSLRADPVSAPGADAPAVARAGELVWAWDTLSLALLLDWAPHTLRRVPTTAHRVADIALRPLPDHDGLPALSLSPWPFTDPDGLVVHTEGRRLTSTFATQAELDAGLAAAPWETTRFALHPAPAER